MGPPLPSPLCGVQPRPDHCPLSPGVPWEPLAIGCSGTQPKRWSSALQSLLSLGKCPEQRGKKRPPSPPRREGGESISQEELCSGGLDVSVLFVKEKHLLEYRAGRSTCGVRWAEGQERGRGGLAGRCGTRVLCLPCAPAAPDPLLMGQLSSPPKPLPGPDMPRLPVSRNDPSSAAACSRCPEAWPF